LQEQSGFADTRIAADEHQGTGNDAATEDTIEFAVA
jgi:hypothetical protein